MIEEMWLRVILPGLLLTAVVAIFGALILSIGGHARVVGVTMEEEMDVRRGLNTAWCQDCESSRLMRPNGRCLTCGSASTMNRAPGRFRLV